MAQSGDGNGKLQLEWVRQEEEVFFFFRHKLCINCGLKEGSVWESVACRGQKRKTISIASIFIKV